MDQRHLPEDFKEFLKLLNANSVQYLLVGGWAVGFYGYSRVTADAITSRKMSGSPHRILQAPFVF